MVEPPNSWPKATGTLLPQHLEHLATTYPDVVYAEISKSPTSLDEGYRHVTYREFNNAVNAFAWWIYRVIGSPNENDGSFPTMVYMGPNDLRYPIMLLGAVKAGYKMLFPTPRYNAEGLSVLISSLNTNIMLIPSRPLPVVEEILSIRKIDTYHVPELIDLLSQEPPQYPYSKTFEQAKEEPLVVLHTSGTTGFPKPIIWTHDWANSVAQGHYLSGIERTDSHSGYESMLHAKFLASGTRMLTMMPPFHASAFFGALLFTIQCGTKLILPPAGIAPSASLASDILEHIEVDIIAMPPPYIEQLGADAELLDKVAKKARSAFWVGGDVSERAGNAIAEKMELWTDLGSTEMGLFPLLREEGDWRHDEWHYVRFHPSLRMEFEAVSPSKKDLEPSSTASSKKTNGSEASTSGTNSHDKPDSNIYEGVMKRNPEWIQPIFKLFLDLPEYRTGDLFTPHPTKKGLWKHHGRADDLLVFSTGEKFHPTEAERKIVESHEDIEEALLIGTRRSAACLLLKLNDDRAGNKSEKDTSAGVSDGIWKAIEELNTSLPTYARISRSNVLIVDKPFAKTAKGSIRRRAVEEEYVKMLDAVSETFSTRGA